jgi:hypothetical protein
VLVVLVIVVVVVVGVVVWFYTDGALHAACAWDTTATDFPDGRVAVGVVVCRTSDAPVVVLSGVEGWMGEWVRREW